jgi:hypothetical protein
MTFLLLAALATVISTVVVVGYSACVMAGRADEVCAETYRRQAIARKEIG